MSNRLPRYKVLLVDDDADISDVTTRILSHEGFDVETANSGRDAFQKISDQGGSFDAILFDVSIPEADIPKDFLEAHKQDIEETGMRHYANLLYLSKTAREKNEDVLPYLYSALTYDTLKTLQSRIHAEDIFPKPYDFSNMVNQLKARLLRNDYKKSRSN